MPPLTALSNQRCVAAAAAVVCLIGAASARDALAEQGSSTDFMLDRTEAQFLADDAAQNAAGLYLVDIESRWESPDRFFYGLWAQPDGTIHRLINGTGAEWATFESQMQALDGQWLDIEITIEGGKRYSAIFLEQPGQDHDYHILDLDDETSFDNFADAYLRQGFSLTDFDSYNVVLTVNYVGIWQRGPNLPMTHLYRELSLAEIQLLLDPPAGRVIDIEQYVSNIHLDYRYALVIAQYDGDPLVRRAELRDHDRPGLPTTRGRRPGR